jgi:hypothetical protein
MIAFKVVLQVVWTLFGMAVCLDNVILVAFHHFLFFEDYRVLHAGISVACHYAVEVVLGDLDRTAKRTVDYMVLLGLVSRMNLGVVHSALSHALNCRDNFLVFRVWHWLLEWIFVDSFALADLEFDDSFPGARSGSV